MFVIPYLIIGIIFSIWLLQLNDEEYTHKYPAWMITGFHMIIAIAWPVVIIFILAAAIKIAIDDVRDSQEKNA